MDWTIMTPENNGLFRPGGSGGSYRYVFEDNDNLYDGVIPAGTKRLYWKSQWSSYNRMYYNPNVTYEPWPTLSDAHPDHPRSHPMHATPTSDLSDSYWEVDTNDPLAGIEVIVDSEDQADLVLTVDGQPSLEPTIIDNEDPEFSSSGPNWRYRSGSDEAYNGDYYDTNNNGDYTATWTPNLQAGEYEVYARWHASTNNASSVAYTITYTGGATDTIWVNQEKNGGKWVLLGTYDFDGGTSGNVTLTHTRPDGSNRACADAVRFKPTSGMWDWATDAEAYNGHYWWTPTDATYTATWTPNLPATPTDTWEVQARWHASNERSTNVTYTINHQAGSDNVIVDQRQNGGEWVSLGTYKFNPGTSGNVTLSHTRTGSTDTACADAVRFVYATPATIDIKRAHYYTWYDADTDEVIDPGEVYLIIVDGEIKYYEFTQDDGDERVEPGDRLQAIAAVDAPDAIKTGRTYAQERQNLANWYSFYRRRELTATNAIAKVIANMTGVKIGFYSINGLLNQPVLPVKVGEQDETATLLSTLYNLVLQRNSTPLRRGLRSVGRYFDADDGSSGGIGSSPFASAAGGGECQQAFAVVMTDGYYNGGSPDLGNTDGDNNTAFDGFAPYSDNYWNSLADVAMHYYERDLVAGLDNIVPTHPEDSATHQHVVTYTVSFGVFGTLDADNYDLLGGSYPTWPNPNQGDQEKIDDLWHAAVNGRGRFLSARDPEELTTQLLIIMQNIEGRIGSSSSVSVNGDELYETLGANIRMFQAQYNSDTWAGDVRAHEIDLTTGEVITSSYLWSAANELENLHWNTRVLATFDGVTGRPFRFDDLTDELKGLLDENWEAGDTNARNILNYLRGDSTNERQYAGTFRDRTQKLGDIVHSSPVFADGRLYAGANDGMLHAFDATTGTELFAYIPKLVFANIEELADPLYSHKFYVDLRPEVEDIGVPGDIGVDDDGDTVIDEAGEEKIKKILVGGLGKGGRGYYALDITDPSTIATESDLAGR
jgi:hypothetical protein